MQRRDIVKAAGLSVGQIYRYFENKEAMVAAIVAQDLAEMREKFAKLGFEPFFTSPEEGTDFMRSELARWARVAAYAGIKAE